MPLEAWNNDWAFDVESTELWINIVRGGPTARWRKGKKDISFFALQK
jgi:hypothetical protein